MFYTKEQVDRLTLKESQKALKLLEKTYSLDKSINECWQEVWPVLDEIVDTLLYLEDRINYIITCDRLDEARPTKEKRAQAKLEESNEDTNFVTNYG
jgi:hypothetical protein